MAITNQTRPLTIEERIEEVVEQTIQRVLGPYLAKLAAPDPVVYAVSQTADVLQVSEDTVARLVKRGVLARVPHIDGKLLIPKIAVTELVEHRSARTADVERTNVSSLPVRPRRRASGP